MNTGAVSTADDPRVTRAVEEYLEALERGERPQRQAFLLRHSAIAVPLGECLDALDFLYAAAGGLRLDGGAQPGDVGGMAPAGGVLGDYRIVREIGRGGMGVVYEARQISLARPVALKVLPFAAVLDPRHLARFKTEALAAAQLDHSHIVDVYGVGCERGVHYYAMRYIEGRTLAAVIAEARGTRRPANAPETRTLMAAPAAPIDAAGAPTQRLDSLSTEATAGGLAWFRAVAEIGVHVAEALGHAHRHGIVHRDIKPSNLLLDEQGKVWVTDFGLAHVETDTNLTLSGDLLGTLRYMSTEQALGNQAEIDHRTDVYSLGVTLYELLTLEPAFPGVDRKTLLRRIAGEEPRPPRRINRSIPPDLETIVLKAMARERVFRYATCRELADDLRRFLEHKPIRARRPSLLERAAKWSRRHRRLVVLSFVLMLFVIAALAATAIITSHERDIAQAERRRAEQMAEDLRQRLYATDMRLAWQAWQNADIPQVLAGLERQRPAAGQDDLRGFEWHYLHALCHSARLTLNGHEGEVYSVAFSPDGAMLASGSQDGTVKLWDLATGREQLTFRGHTDEVNGVSFSPDASMVVSAGDDATIRLWNVGTGEETGVLRGHTEAVFNAVFSPDGRTLASGGRDDQLRLWDVARGRPLATLEGHTGNIESLVFSRDGSTIATAGGDCAQTPIILWNVESQRGTVMPMGHTSHLLAVALSPDGKLVASGGEDWTARLWDAATGDERATLRGHGESVQWAAFAPDGRTLATASRDATVRLWDVEHARLRSILRGHSGRVWCVAFSPDGRLLATAGADRTVKLWNAHRQQTHERLLTVEAAQRVLVSPRGETFVAIDRQGEATFWRHGSAAPVKHRLNHTIPEAPLPLAFSPENDTLAVAVDLGRIELWHPAAGRQLKFEVGNEIRTAAFSPDGRLLACGRFYDDIAVWELSPRPRELRTLEGHFGGVNAVAFSPDGRLLASASQDTTVRLWDVDSGQAPVELLGHRAGVRSLTFSSDGRMIATGSDDRTVRLWNASTGRELATLLGHTGFVACLGFSPDGKTLASGGDDQTVRLWHVATGQELFALRAHTGCVTSLEFTADGRSLVSAAVGADDSAEFYVWPPPRDPMHGPRDPRGDQRTTNH